jgi:hypothetical protein
MEEFNSRINGELNEQDWVGPEMDKFHEKISNLKQFHCDNCNELWPNEKEECQNCKKDALKYSSENNMNPKFHELPFSIKSEFEKLTMIEEMLISPILTVMSVFRLPGGQLLSRGYVANFSQDISEMCKTLPRKTKEIPILIVKKTDQNNNSKEFKVNRLRVEKCLKFLCENNPDWIKKGNKFDQTNCDCLPEDSIPTDLNEIINGDLAPETLDDIIIQTGPTLVEEPIEEQQQDFIQTVVECDIEEPFQIDRIEKFISCNWPQADSTPINEFTFEGIPSLSFPSLFPLGLADPTKKARQITVSETEAYQHLLKYGTTHTDTKQLYYPFVNHPRFKFWAYDRIRRHRALDQSKICLKQNLGIII